METLKAPDTRSRMWGDRPRKSCSSWGGAIHGAGVDAGGILRSDAGFGNDIGHGPPPAFKNYGMPPGRKIQAEPR